LTHQPGALRQPTAEEFQAVQESAEFRRLRSSFRSFAFPMTWLYVRHANKSLDPVATRLRTELEGGV